MSPARWLPAVFTVGALACGDKEDSLGAPVLTAVGFGCEVVNDTGLDGDWFRASVGATTVETLGDRGDRVARSSLGDVGLTDVVQWTSDTGDVEVFSRTLEVQESDSTSSQIEWSYSGVSLLTARNTCCDNTGWPESWPLYFELRTTDGTLLDCAYSDLSGDDLVGVEHCREVPFDATIGGHDFRTDEVRELAERWCEDEEKRK